jgi:WD40 repeat protein
VEGKSLLFELRGHWGYIYSLAFSADGSMLASGADDNTIQIWSMKTGEQVEKKSFGSEPNTLAYSNDGKYLAAGTYDRGVRILNTSDWSIYKKISLGKWGFPTGLSFSKDSTELAIASHNIPSIIINMKNGEVLYEIDETQCGYVGYSIDEDNLYLGCTNIIKSTNRNELPKFSGKILLWHPKEGKVDILYHNDDITSMDPARFSPDKEIFAIISDSPASNKLMVVEISSGKELFTYELSEGYIDKMSYSPDGRIVALGVVSESWSEIFLFGVR